jgi:alkylation response protein AidB-like acyl-CoA dehydrogenase
MRRRGVFAHPSGCRHRYREIQAQSSRKDEPIERIWREVRAIRIPEGTSEIMRHIIARDMLRLPIFTI